MQRRISACLKNPITRNLVLADFRLTFEQIGFSAEKVEEVLRVILEKLESTESGEDLKRVEQEVSIYFQDLEEKFGDRSEIIFGQIEPSLREIIKDGEYELLDWGCGDGEVTRRIHERLAIPVVSCDVRDYRSEAFKASGSPFLTVQNSKLFGENDKPLDTSKTSFRIGLMTNVAHHEKDNDLLLEAISELVTDYLIVIETVPHPDSEQSEEVERERTFMNDYLYNRLFHNADVPVPGTYETREGWIERFKKHGWQIQGDLQNLGIDQPTIQDYHVLYVFKRIA